MKKACTPRELSLKSFFVGPQAENADILLRQIQLILEQWIDWRKSYFPHDGPAISYEDTINNDFIKNIKKMNRETKNLLNQFSKEIPKFSPRYLGHMFSEISMPSIVGHMIALLHNPNNISRESSWVGTDIERLSILELSRMVGYTDKAIGHFTSGGTIANFEAILRSKYKITKSILSSHKKDFNDACYATHPLNRTFQVTLSDLEIYKKIQKKYKLDFAGHTLLVPDSQHYSWTKGASLFSIGQNNLAKIPLNKYGQMSIKHLKKTIDSCLNQKRPIACITSVFGTTELGTVDSISEIQHTLNTYKQKYGYQFWHHVDAAYGGFFACAKNNPIFDSSILQSIQTLPSTSSITIDPHKLGYVPYSAGVFLCQSREDYYIHKTVAPYVNFDTDKDLGPYTIEGSRPATGAVALYLSSKCIGLDNSGYGKILERTISSAKKFKELASHAKSPLLFVSTVGTNIVCFAIGSQGENLSSVNKRTLKFLERAMKKQTTPHKKTFFISKTHLSRNYSSLIKHFCAESNLKMDTNDLPLARITFMNPFVDSRHSKTAYLQDFVKYIKSLCK